MIFVNLGGFQSRFPRFHDSLLVGQVMNFFFLHFKAIWTFKANPKDLAQSIGLLLRKIIPTPQNVFFHQKIDIFQKSSILWGVPKLMHA